MSSLLAGAVRRDSGGLWSLMEGGDRGPHGSGADKGLKLVEAEPRGLGWAGVSGRSGGPGKKTQGSSDSLGAWPPLAIRSIRGSTSQQADNSRPWHSVGGCPADEPVSLLGLCLVVLCASQLLDGGTCLLDAVSPELASRRVPRIYLCPVTWGHGPQHPRLGLS